jgi:hypothetical protein
MYAYVATKQGQQTEFFETAEYDEAIGQFVSATAVKPHEIAYWRKHPNLHGWMEQLWRSKDPNAGEDSFNGVELELTWEDLMLLEQDILSGRLPDTTGFFFGEPADDYYREQDLEFVKKAKAELFVGLRVFYNSSW